MEKIKKFFKSAKSYIIYAVTLILAILALVFLGKKTAKPISPPVDRSKARQEEADAIEERSEKLIEQADDALRRYYENKKTGR